MIGAVHVGVGAATGSLLPSKLSAFLAGIASHILTDAAPHRDYDPRIEVPLIVASLAATGGWRGFGSTEFWGALGAIAPDVEHGLVIAGIIEPQDEVFPTHAHNGKLHGPETRERWSQLLVVIASVAAIALAQDHSDASHPPST